MRSLAARFRPFHHGLCLIAPALGVTLAACDASSGNEQGPAPLGDDASTSADGPSAHQGVCGPANGVAAPTAPTTNLCRDGTASAVVGTGAGGAGPWSWTCDVGDDGTSASCSAPLGAMGGVNGACGSANGVATMTAPASGLCSSGTATAVTGSGPWDWSCNGSGGGTNASCFAPLESLVGACGSANGVATSTAPTTNLCAAGTPTPVTGTGPWTWSCDGSAGGTNASCSAPLLVVNGACGSAQGVASATAPTTNLCSSGTATAVTQGA